MAVPRNHYWNYRKLRILNGIVPFFAQVLCNTGNLTSIPRNFPEEVQEIVITNQNITEIPPNGNYKIRF